MSFQLFVLRHEMDVVNPLLTSITVILRLNQALPSDLRMTHVKWTGPVFLGLSRSRAQLLSQSYLRRPGITSSYPGTADLTAINTPLARALKRCCAFAFYAAWDGWFIPMKCSKYSPFRLQPMVGQLPQGLVAVASGFKQGGVGEGETDDIFPSAQQMQAKGDSPWLQPAVGQAAICTHTHSHHIHHAHVVFLCIYTLGGSINNLFFSLVCVCSHALVSHAHLLMC